MDTKKIRIEYHVIDKCNLNCKSCSHFSNLVDREIPKSLDKIRSDLTRLWELTDHGSPDRVEKVTVLGGEPLLYPQLVPALDMIKSMFPHEYDHGPLQVVTNGTLITRQPPEFFECLRRNDVVVCISLYGLPDSIYQEAFDRLNQEGVRWFWYAAYTPENRLFSTKFLHNHFDENYREYAQDCVWRLTCTQIVDNRMYLCALIAYFKHFDAKFKGQHEIEVTEDDYIDLDKVRDFDHLLAERQKIPRFCGHCRGSHALSEPWGLTKGTIDEFLWDGPPDSQGEAPASA